MKKSSSIEKITSISEAHEYDNTQYQYQQQYQQQRQQEYEQQEFEQQQQYYGEEDSEDEFNEDNYSEHSNENYNNNYNDSYTSSSEYDNTAAYQHQEKEEIPNIYNNNNNNNNNTINNQMIYDNTATLQYDDEEEQPYEQYDNFSDRDYATLGSNPSNRARSCDESVYGNHGQFRTLPHPSHYNNNNWSDSEEEDYYNHSYTQKQFNTLSKFNNSNNNNNNNDHHHHHHHNYSEDVADQYYNASTLRTLRSSKSTPNLSSYSASRASKVQSNNLGTRTNIPLGAKRMETLVNVEPDLMEKPRVRGDSNNNSLTDLKKQDFIFPQETNFRINGFFEKQGGSIKNWKRRWFVLVKKDFEINYYSSNNEKEKKGSIKLRNCKVYVPHYSDALPEKKVKNSLAAETLVYFAIETRSRTYHIRTNNKKQRKAWLDALERLITEANGLCGVMEILPPMKKSTKLNKADQKWRKHWCMLDVKQHRLHYYDTCHASKPRGCVELFKAQISKCDDDTENSFEPCHHFYVSVSQFGKQTFMRFTNPVDRDCWVDKFNNASKGLVAEKSYAFDY
eukprot:Pgem_evm1s19187